MNLIRSMRSMTARLFALTALSLTGLNVSAVPLAPGMLMDPQFQACLDESALANGWTLTEEVTSLKCSDRNIQILAGVENLTSLLELDLSDNQISNVAPIDLIPQLNIINLSNNALLDIFPLQPLTNLTQLNLSGNSRLMSIDVQNLIQFNPGLTHIGVAGIDMGDLSWLPPMGPMGEHNLIELDISHTGSFPDLAPQIGQYSNLRVLKAAGNKLQHAGQLEFLTQLEVIDLSDNQLMDVSSLLMLNGLTQLNLTGNRKLAPWLVQQIIQSNPGLTHIGVGGIAMNDLNWLPPMGPMGEFNLLELDISSIGKIMYLGPQIAQYTNLRVLKAASNHMLDPGPLDQLMSLEVLDLSDNKLMYAFQLQMLNGLKQLNLSDNPQLDPMHVQQIIQTNLNLTHVGVAGIGMGDLSWLPPSGPMGEFNFIELDLSRTGSFPDLFPLMQYTNLRVLKAAGNQLQNVGPLDQLLKLEVLDLSDNSLIDIFPLQMLNGLTEINLSGNSQLDAFSVLQIIHSNPGLTHIGVADIAMGDLGWLPPAGPMGEFNLIELDISNTGTFPDLSLLLQYPNLRVIKAAGNKIFNTMFLDQLTELEVLDLSNNILRDINSLQMTFGLTQLNLTGNHQLEPWIVQQVIQSNPGLTHIGVGDIGMGELYWLPGAGPMGEFDLLELDITHTGLLTDLSPLAQYPNLRVLKAADNQIQNTRFLDQLINLEVLDLSDNQLVDVYPYPLQMLNGLKQLYLSGNSKLDPFAVQQIIHANPGLTHIGVSGIALGDLNWLPPAGPMGEFNLNELDISYTGVLMDLSPLAQYTNLSVLKAAGNQIQNLGPMDQLQKLKILDLSDNQLSEVSALQMSLGLKQLNLSDNQLIDVYSLQILNGLEQLNLSGNSSLDPFAVQQIIYTNPGLTHIGVSGIKMGDLNWLPPVGSMGEFNLIELDISHTGVLIDLYPLIQYTDLRALKVAGNQLQNVGPIDQLPKLEVLDLSDNQLLDVYSLQMLNGLKQLYLSGNSKLDQFVIQQIIQANPGLTHLGIAEIAMHDLYWLPPMGYQGEYNLIELDISSTGVYFDLAPLTNYPNLRVLKASGNQLQNAWPLDQLLKLEVLDLSDNILVDVYPLQMLHGLTQLSLTGNFQLDALTVQQVIQANPGLTHIAVGGIEMGELFWLPPMGPMGEFNLLELDISYTGSFVDLSPLMQYPNLRVIKAAGNHLQNVGPLDQLQQLEILDLSDNQLIDIYSLQMLHGLKQLNLTGNHQLDSLLVQQIILSNPGLTHIGVGDIWMGDLNWLPPMGLMGEYNLLELDVSNIGTLTDLMPLVQYPNLRVLNASGNKLQNPGPLDQLTQLEVLNLSDNQLFDISSLQMLGELKQLNLSNNNFIYAFDVQFIVQANPKLTHLSVAGINMGDLNWLPPIGYQGEFNFEELDISSTGVITDASILSQYTNLKVLKASNNSIQTIWSFDQLQSLEVLDLSSNRLAEIGSLNMLRNLRELNLSNNILPDPFSPGVDLFSVNQVIDNNPGLTHLGVAGMYIGMLNQLSIFMPNISEKIVELDVSHTGIMDINGISALMNLRVLKAAGNIISDINPVVSLQQLEILDLSNNDILFVLPLGSMVNLDLLDLSENNHIQCTELDQLEAQFSLLPGQLIRPANCVVSTPPSVQILSPLNASSSYETNSITLVASATDLEDGVLDSSIQWSSNLSGAIGTGSSVSTSLTAGEHVVTAVVSDRDSNTSSASINVTVIANTVPDLVIYPIAINHNEGEVITLTAAANDAEEGDVSAGIQWNSSIDGAIGSGSVISPTLSVGAHIISANITDNTGAASTTSVSVVVNGLPQVAISLPLTGEVLQQGESVTLSATATDVEDGVLSAGITWTSNLDGLIGTGAQVSKVLSVGVHVITASITDSAGAINAQTSSVTVNAQPVVTLNGPASGSLYMLQEVVNLSAAANDAEDGVISATIQWSSNLDGVLGTGAALTTNLSLGTHTITAQITDSAGGTHSATTQVVIDQIDLAVAVSGNGFRKFATLTWSGSRTAVDVYKNGNLRRTGTADGSKVFRFRNQATFKVCETGTNNCSVDVIAVAQ